MTFGYTAPIQWDTRIKGRGAVGIGEAEELIHHAQIAWMPAEERRRYALTGPPPPGWFTEMLPAPWITGRVIAKGRKLVGASLVHLDDDGPDGVPADVPPATTPPVPAQRPPDVPSDVPLAVPSPRSGTRPSPAFGAWSQRQQSWAEDGAFARDGATVPHRPQYCAHIRKLHI